MACTLMHLLCLRTGCRAATRMTAAVCALALCLSAQADDNALDVFLDGLNTFSADFEQILLNPSGEVLEATRGVVRLRRPGMFYWLYNEPYTQKIISDGASLWVYEADLEQVTISDISAAITDSPALIFNSNHELDEHYLVTELGRDARRALFELTPRNPESHYRSLHITLSDKTLADMTLYDRLGQTLLLTFENARRNADIKEELFRFTATDDMEIIDTRQRD